MELTPEQARRVEQLSAELACPRECACHTCDFKTLGRVQRVGDTSLWQCLDKRGTGCPEGLPFGKAIFCHCRLRLYVAEVLGL